MVVFEPKELGKRLRGARTVAGFESMREVNKQLDRVFGVTYSERGLLAIERGEQMPTFDQFLTLILLYDPPGGIEFFFGSIRPEFSDDFKRIFCSRL
jgi:hypothetical protein